MAREGARRLPQQREGHAGRSGMEPMERWLAREAVRAVLACSCGMEGVSVEAELVLGCVDGAFGVVCFARRLRRCLRSFLPAARSMRRCRAWALRVTLLGPGRLVTRRWSQTGKCAVRSLGAKPRSSLPNVQQPCCGLRDSSGPPMRHS